MHVGEHRDAEFFAQLREDGKRLVETDAARAVGAGGFALSNEVL